MKKILTIILSMLLFITPLTGCNKDSDVDETKTQLYIGVFDGGIGTAYLDAVIEKFENDPVISTTQFEDGKTGVEVIYEESKDDYSVSALSANAKYMREDIFITNDVSMTALINEGIAADITSIVTEKVYSDNGELVSGGSHSIASLMEGYAKNYYNVGTESAEQYYAVPYAATLNGIVYDADLFDEKDYYFNTDDELICKTDYSNTTKSLGSDGVESYDDGLPKTWEQFKLLMSTMSSDGIIPLTWAYQPVISYRINPLISMWAQYEGANDFELNYNYSGTDTKLGEITEENAYKLYEQDGRLAALTAAKDIISDPKNYSTHCFYSSQTHTEAQKEYISSIRGGQTRIAMLLEGGWWENEARSVFDEMSGMNENYGYGKRNFKFMPMPNFIGTPGVPDQTYDGRTLNILQVQANICVNKKSEKMELCKAFIQYLHTTENLRAFTKETGVFKPYEYTLTDDDYNQLTPFAKNCWDIFSDPAVEKVTTLTTSLFRSYLGSKVEDREWQTKIEGYGEFREPMEAFFNNPQISAKDYMDGAISYYNDLWSGEYSKYLSSL